MFSILFINKHFTKIYYKIINICHQNKAQNIYMCKINNINIMKLVFKVVIANYFYLAPPFLKVDLLPTLTQL